MALRLSGALCSICKTVDTSVVEGVEKGAKKVRVHVGCPESRCELLLSGDTDGARLRKLLPFVTGALWFSWPVILSLRQTLDLNRRNHRDLGLRDELDVEHSVVHLRVERKLLCCGEALLS